MPTILEKESDQIISLLKDVKRNIELLNGDLLSIKELSTVLPELSENIDIMLLKVQNLIENGWRQSNNEYVASKERHDLYGNITKINFSLEFVMMLSFKEISNKVRERCGHILEVEHDLYHLLKQVFEADKNK